MSEADVTEREAAPAPGEGAEDQDGRRSGAGRLRRALSVVLATVLVLAVVLVVVEFSALRPRSRDLSAEQQNRSAAIRAAERFTVQTNTYDSTSMKAYQSSMDTMMSPKFKADYTKVIDQLSSTIRQAKISSKGVVLASAVASLDSDSAQVLVVSDAAVKTVYDPNLARHFRWEISLVRIDGSWLVDDFTPVN